MRVHRATSITRRCSAYSVEYYIDVSVSGFEARGSLFYKGSLIRSFQAIKIKNNKFSVTIGMNGHKATFVVT
ncbi:hypothetical protein EVB32_073 [Rhizobium phage RHph_TM39]|nr:hypothetical protein EVB32_073 [Rhizobium phage RHph_TM39]QIG77660.1 hypothetical protein EVB64_073 [Rhizobium phage RHph_TM61]